MHLIFDCTPAQRLWQEVVSAFNDILSAADPEHTPVMISSDLILFNHPPEGLSQLHSRDLIDIIMLGKHAIIKLKYRQNQERSLNERLLIATVSIDADKIIAIRTRAGQPLNIFDVLVQKLKTLVGF